MTAFPGFSRVNSGRGLCLGVQKGRGERKRLGLKEAGFDVGKGCGSTEECCSGVSTVVRIMWESMRPPFGDSDGTIGANSRDLSKIVRDLC